MEGAHPRGLVNCWLPCKKAGAQREGGMPYAHPRVTVRRVGQSPLLPFACCGGSLRSDGRGGRCSLWCRFRDIGSPVVGAPGVVLVVAGVVLQVLLPTPLHVQVVHRMPRRVSVCPEGGIRGPGQHPPNHPLPPPPPRQKNYPQEKNGICERNRKFEAAFGYKCFCGLWAWPGSRRKENYLGPRPQLSQKETRRRKTRRPRTHAVRHRRVGLRRRLT